MVWYSHLFKNFPQFIGTHTFKGFNVVNEAVKVKVTQLCPTLCNPMDYTVHGILQARLQQYVNFQMFKLVSEKAEEPEIKLPTSAGSSKKSKRVPEKHLFLHY